MVMRVIAGNSTLGRVWRKLIQGVQKRYYPYLTRLVADHLLFLNMAIEEDPPMALPLDGADEPNRYPIQLYHATAN